MYNVVLWSIKVIDYGDVELLQINYGNLGLIKDGIGELQMDSIACRKLRFNQGQSLQSPLIVLTSIYQKNV